MKKVGGQYEIVPQCSNVHTLRKSGVLLADAQLCNDCTIALDVLLGEVVEQAAALTDHLVHAQTAVLVVGMHLQVLGELMDALGENRDLHLRRTGVALVRLVGFDNGSLFFLRNHGNLPFFFVMPAGAEPGGKAPEQTGRLPNPGTWAKS